MSSTTEYLESWHRLTESDLAGVNAIISNEKLRRLSPELLVYIGLRLVVQVRHENELRTIPQHELPWKTVDNPALSRMYKAAVAIERGSSGSETLGEWAGLMQDAVAYEMCDRLAITAASRAESN